LILGGVDEGVLVIVVVLSSQYSQEELFPVSSPQCPNPAPSSKRTSPQYSQAVLLPGTITASSYHTAPPTPPSLSPYCWGIKDRFNFVGSRGGSVLQIDV
jgi:hypothetical protein